MKTTTKQPFGHPDSPVISRSECAVTLRLVRALLRNLIERGDLPETMLERCEAFEQYIDDLKLRANQSDFDWFGAVASSGLLPSFHAIYDDEAEEALVMLERLVQKRACRAA
jgi:hypothetical protein